MAFRFGFFEDSAESTTTAIAAVDNNTKDSSSLSSTTSTTFVDFKSIPEFCQDASTLRTELLLASSSEKNNNNNNKDHTEEDEEDEEVLEEEEEEEEEEEDAARNDPSFLEWDPERDIVTLDIEDDKNNETTKKPPAIRYFSSHFLKKALTGTSLADVDSDIIQGFYLGGLKCWSCTADVVKTIFDINNSNNSSNNTNDEKWYQPIITHLSSINANGDFAVADIGCGLGLCGISCITSSSTSTCLIRPSRVLFHDFNKEIATMVVSGTLSLNTINKNDATMVKVAAGWGDWTKYYPTTKTSSTSTCSDQHQLPLQVDLIVAADVSYDEEASIKFLEITSRLLKKGTGIAIVGTKAFYFGTNGGIDSLLGTNSTTNDDTSASASTTTTTPLLKKYGLKLLCKSPRIGGESDMLRYVLCLVKSSSTE